MTNKISLPHQMRSEVETSGKFEVVNLQHALPEKIVAANAKRSPSGFFAAYLPFGVLCLLPVLISTLYFAVIASDRFVSEARFVIRTAGSSDPSGLGMLMRGETSSRVADDTHAVNAYILSRDAAAELTRDHNLRQVMSRPEADIFARFPNFYTRNNDENFYEAYKNFVDVRVESSTGISTLRVSAFRPEDARQISQALLDAGERFVNRLRERAIQDELAFARAVVDDARKQLTDVVERLAGYRNEAQTLDPQAESTNRFAALTKLATEISQLEAAMAQQIAMAPQSPTLAPMREKIRSIRDEMERQKKVLVGAEGSMATKFQAYELLMIEREIASKTLVEAVIRMEVVRQERQRQSLYLQRIVEPNLPDYPASPYRILGIMLSLIISIIVFAIAKTMMRLTLEHTP